MPLSIYDVNFQMKQSSRAQEVQNREQLLTMRFTTNAASNAAAATGSGSDTSLLIDRALDHQTALDVRNQNLAYLHLLRLITEVHTSSRSIQ
jgi:hypothetical protein